MKLKNSVEEHMGKIALLERGVTKAKSELQESRAINLSVRVLSFMDGMGKTFATSVKQVPSSSGGAKKHHSDMINMSIDKQYKLMVKSKTTQSPETIKNGLKTNQSNCNESRY